MEESGYSFGPAHKRVRHVRAPGQRIPDALQAGEGHRRRAQGACSRAGCSTTSAATTRPTRQARAPLPGHLQARRRHGRGRCARWLVQAQDQGLAAVRPRLPWRHAGPVSCRHAPPPHRLGLALAACLVAGPAYAAKVAHRTSRAWPTRGRAERAHRAVAQRRARQGPQRAPAEPPAAPGRARNARSAGTVRLPPTITIRRSDRDLPVGQRANRRRPMPTRSTIPMTATGRHRRRCARRRVHDPRRDPAHADRRHPDRARRAGARAPRTGRCRRAGRRGRRRARTLSRSREGARARPQCVRGRQEADLQCPAAARLFRCRPRQPPVEVTRATSPPTSTCAGPPANATAWAKRFQQDPCRSSATTCCRSW